jgi:carbon monoxide dehydrogenase subunit G
MARFSAEATIKAQPDQVFAYVSDMNRHGEWGGHDLAVKQTSAGAIAVGSTFTSTAKAFGTQREAQTVTAFDPGKKFAFEATGGLGLARHEFDLSAVDGGTRVTKSMELIKPSFLAKVMSMKIKSDQRRELAQDLSRIKAKLEAGT